MDDLEFKNLTSEEFDEYLKHHRENDYLVIDVRQESEYELGHIPGAKLIPLVEVETRLFSLPADRDLIFYCQNGGRSQWAASLAGESEVSQKTVFNLMGGLLNWQGPILTGYPKVQIFDKDQDLEHLLTTAMNLEKGAWRFYRFASDKYNDDPIGRTFEQISIAEKGHATLIYRFWQKFKTSPPPFDQLYHRLAGDILEGGQSFEEACKVLEATVNRSCAAMIDLALVIEYTAFDLYRTMAERTADSEARETFLTVAQAEKAHMRALARSIAQCPDRENV
ncbi:MAG: sulfurtransferase [Desulfobacterales bacterium]|nr:MAG: sulfurtransferase [Desulfobacterales bacterium]